MAGQPKKRAIIAELTKRAHEEIGENATPLDYAVQYCESGGTLLKLADDLGATLGYEVYRSRLGEILNELEPNAETRLGDARRAGARALAEQAIDIVDKADDTSREKLQHAKMRADVRQWTAGKWNRDEYGDSKAATLNITVNTLHLDSLRLIARPEQEIHNPMRQPRVTAQFVESVVDAEVEGEQLELDMSPRMPPSDATR